MEEIRREFLSAMMFLWPHGIPDDENHQEQHRCLAQAFIMGWIIALRVTVQTREYEYYLSQTASLIDFDNGNEAVFGPEWKITRENYQALGKLQ